MKKFTVATSSPYDVILGPGLLSASGSYFSQLIPAERSSVPTKAVVVSDSTVGELYYDALAESLRLSGFDTYRILFPAGEHSKTLTTFSNVLESFADLGLTRSDMVIALGGGVVTDIAGFAAGTYLRGIKYGIIPTSFQSAIDTSIGGKSCINLLKGKNLAGIFWQPSLVLCDTDIIISSDHEPGLSDGLSEAVKYAVISDRSLLNSIMKRDYAYILERCISIKKSLVEADERGLGLRQLLDFGHTLGRGIEKLSSYNISHGQALAKGMVIEARGAFSLGLSENDITEELEDILSSLGFETASGYDPDSLYSFALLDEKISGDVINMPIAESIGKATLKKLTLSKLKSLIAAGVSG